jgi:adenylate cyclase
MHGAEPKRPEATVDPHSGLSHVAIRAQLDRILASREFHATDKMRDFLRFVVEEKLAGRSHRLKGYTIATRVFGPRRGLRRRQDPIVRIQAGRLRRALERYYLVGGVSDPILIDIPKGRYIPRFTFSAERAPERRRSRSSTDATKASGRTRDRPIPGGAAVREPHRRSRAAFLTVGLTEELVTELTRFQDIAVIPCHRPKAVGCCRRTRSSSAGSRRALHPPGQRSAATRDRQGLRPAHRHHRPAPGLGRLATATRLDASHLIATQERIAQRVVGDRERVRHHRPATVGRVPQEAPGRARDLRGDAALLQPPDRSRRRSPPRRASTRFGPRRKEPEYGPVWSALATLHCQMYTFDVPGSRTPLDTALEYARKGVFLEPGSQLARMILAYASYLAEDSESFREESETALALNPNSPYTVGAIGYFHALRGDLARGLPCSTARSRSQPVPPRGGSTPATWSTTCSAATTSGRSPRPASTIRSSASGTMSCRPPSSASSAGSTRRGPTSKRHSGAEAGPRSPRRRADAESPQDRPVGRRPGRRPAHRGARPRFLRLGPNACR